MNLRSSGQPKIDVKTLFSILHHLSPVIFANNSGIITASQFYVQLPLLYTEWTKAYSEIGPEVAAATFHDFLRERSRRAFTLANQLCWTAQCVWLHDYAMV